MTKVIGRMSPPFLPPSYSLGIQNGQDLHNADVPRLHAEGYDVKTSLGDSQTRTTREPDRTSLITTKQRSWKNSREP
ncbi:hypothetical protein AX15_007877 [Amanita polypyramis BW_CC]|nr:hypothetical protein AX15_007877 [Amanita polypyramis BW_CC]